MKKRYEYACDKCDYRTIILETSKEVDFSDIAHKAVEMDWQYDVRDGQETLTCPDCLILVEEDVLLTSIPAQKPAKNVIPTKLLTIAFIIFGILSITIFWSNNNIEQTEQIIVDIDQEEFFSDEEVEINAELALAIEQDPEKFLAKEEAVSDEDVSEEHSEEKNLELKDIVSTPAREAADIKKEILAQSGTQDEELSQQEEEQLAKEETLRIEQIKLAKAKALKIEQTKLAKAKALKIEQTKLAKIEALKTEQETLAKIEQTKLEALKIKNEVLAKKALKEKQEAKQKKPLTRGKYAIFSGTVQSNLGQAAEKVGLGFSQVKKILSIFSYSVNFKRIAKGDSFIVIFNKKDLAKNGSSAKILAAEFRTRGKAHQRIYYTNGKGKSAYYLLKSKGPSKTITEMTKGSKNGFLRYALKYNHISSNFNLRRRHPISRRIRPHKGTDFAAPKGRKVWSTANGTVVFSGWQRGYGKVVKISHHNGKYQTVYAHMSKIARGIRKGKRVKQKQTIGYVGSTGGSTGNHLHYEFKVRGRAVNAMRVKLPKSGKTVTRKVRDPKEQKRFKNLAKIMAYELKVARSKVSAK